ncbi:VirB6/TrbL-like conjugal transfer protein, CD1112 family [Anaerotignum sp.]|uniref:VirB6/TrbL-like conjugal transfer protein, CD1112 family n=1 Tax=Anaerotignum sp. TaxID=2039241 RepID=UPI0028AD5E00|nr:CD0415/CD1112 family protein [Anaerotignum sp.]
MQSIIDAITEWIKEILISGIIGNLTGMFDTVNSRVGEIASEVGKTPSQWNDGVFSLIQNLSETVVIPIAGIVLTFVMCYELISMIIDKNNMHDFPPSDIFKWIMKTFMAVLIVTNVFDIVMAIFDVSQTVVANSAGLIIGDAGIHIEDAIANLETVLGEMDIGPLLGLFVQSMLIGATMWALSFCIFIVIYGRMMEIYMVTSLAPIPFATMGNKEWGSMGQNYIKSICALGFQAFLIMVCVGIYSVLVNDIAMGDDPINAIWSCLGYTLLLCFTLFKTGTIAKGIFSAH